MRRRDTLILNADGYPMSVLPIKAVSWQDGIKAVWMGAHVLHEYESWVVHSPREEFRVPSVIMLSHMVKWKRHASFTKRHLCLRDGFRCQYCGETFPEGKLTKDHVIPRSVGGPMKWENIVASCHPCNRDRGNDQKIRPMREPYRPTYYELAEKAKRYPIWVPDIVWGDYLGWDKDLVRII